jgi:hypothetical protein
MIFWLILIPFLLYTLMTFGNLLLEINRVPWTLDTALMCGALVLGCLTIRRSRFLGVILLLYATVIASNTLHSLPTPGEYADVPPSNTLEIPQKVK